MGDDAYRRYLGHRARAHPGEPVLSQGQYWRARHDAADLDPGAHCC